MAVVQISKIQIRRGLKNSGIGVPQLSSAEFAWAVDSQELFIGNGSLEEGAPYVGNTKILTEHDNILELINGYTFGNDDPSIVNSVFRTLQSKLDEYVSVFDYGAVPDGSTNCLSAFQNAFDDLFKNTDDKFKKKLFVPNGVYLIVGQLNVPSDAIIVGENKEQTILDMDTSEIKFVTSDNLSYVDFTSSNRPENIVFENFTILRSSGQLDISGIKDSKFVSMKFQGEYELGGEGYPTLDQRNSSVYWINEAEGKKVDNIVFENCQFVNTELAVKCEQTTVLTTEVKFDSCMFSACETAVFVDGILGQTNEFEFVDCKFDEIYSYAFFSTAGKNVSFDRCKFRRCGNGTALPSNPVTPIIQFFQSDNNKVLDCSFDRHQASAISTLLTVTSIPEVRNSSITKISDRIDAPIYLSDSFIQLSVFSLFNRFTKIDYTLRLGSHLRTGIIEIALDEDFVPHLTDSYSYSSFTYTSSGGPLMTNFEFTIDTDSSDTMRLLYKNPLASGQVGTITYDVIYGV